MDFESWLSARQYATTTQAIYGQYARRLERFTDAATCTSADLAEFFETIPHTAPSHRQCRKALVAYMKYLKRDPNPAEAIHRASEPHRLPRPLTEDEHHRWVAAAHALGGPYELAGVLLASTGCRQGELRKARWDDFALVEPGTWRVRGKGARQAGPIWRQQPLHPIALDVLQMAVRRGEWLFPGSEGHMTDRAMRTLIIRIGDMAGLGRVTGHRIRHSVGTLALARSGDLRAVQTLLGHRSINSTVLYTALVPGTLTELVGELPV